MSETRLKEINPSIGMALFLTVFGTYILLSPAHFLTAPDEEINLRTTLSLLQGNFGAVESLEGFATQTGIDGKEYAQYGLGLPLASLPWCVLGTFLDGSETEDSTIQRRTFDTLSVGSVFLRWWMTVFSMMLCSFTIALFYSMCRYIGLDKAKAIFVSSLLAFCTYTWPHGRTFFTEPLATFCLMMAVWCLIRFQYQSRKYAWILGAGLFWGYAVLTRLDSLITLPAAAWFLLIQQEKDRIRVAIDIRKITLFIFPWIVIMGWIMFYNYYRFHSFFSTGYEDQPEQIRFITPLLVGLQGFLFTPGRSLFVYSPPLILALFGLISFWKRDQWLAGGSYILIISYLCIMSKWQNWAGGYDWGPRHIYQVTPFLMLPVAVWIRDRNLFDGPRKRIGWFVLIFIALWIQLLGLSADPVLIIKWFMKRMLLGFSHYGSDLSNYLSPYFMQFPIYLPQFSSLSLHWQWIMSNGADLMIIKAFTENPKMLYLFLIPIGMILYGMIQIVRGIRGKEIHFKTFESLM